MVIDVSMLIPRIHANDIFTLVNVEILIDVSMFNVEGREEERNLKCYTAS